MPSPFSGGRQRPSEARPPAGVLSASGPPAAAPVAPPARSPSAAAGRALRVRRPVDARPGAALGQVADALGGPALDVRRVELVRRAVVADAVALLGDVADARGSAALRRALRVGRTLDARAGAVL